MSTMIGIDLGTTYSCVAVYQHGQVEVIANDQGNRTTPSYVAFTDTERLIGDAAKAQVAMNPTNTVFDVKRLIGRPFDDGNIREDIKHWPFAVVNSSGKPRIEVEYRGEQKQFTPEEISAMVLEKMKATAEAYLGSKVTDAVITVPAHFSSSQRQATKNAGRIAGLDVKRIIPEPTAAAFAYGMENKLSGEQKILVFDLGGGTLDVSILSITDGSMFEVLSTAGNAHLGGEDFDNIMFNCLVDEFKRINGKDLRGDARAMRRLRTACETAKCALSCSTEASIGVDELHQGIDFRTKMTRARFEELCMDLFRSTLKSVENALKDANLNKSDIQEIVLVGGSTRIPKIQKLVQEFFNGKELCKAINADEAVAHGAAVQAAILSGEPSTAIQEVLLVDVTPLTLGIETIGGIMNKLIGRNTPIPTRQCKNFTTSSDDQTEIGFTVYEGERIKVNDNTMLGNFSLTDIRPAPRGEPVIKVTFAIDSNGILEVHAQDEDTGCSKRINITYEGILSPTEVDEMIADAERFRAEDSAERKRIVARGLLNDFIISIRQKVSNTDVKLDESQRQRGTEIYKRAFKWLDENLSAEKDEFEQQLQKLQWAIQSFMV